MEIFLTNVLLMVGVSGLIGVNVLKVVEIDQMLIYNLKNVKKLEPDYVKLIKKIVKGIQ